MAPKRAPGGKKTSKVAAAKAAGSAAVPSSASAEHDALRAELRRCLQEEEASARELEEAVRARDAEIQRVERSKAARRAQELGFESMLGQLRSMEKQIQDSEDEEMMWKGMVTSMKSFHEEELAALKRARTAQAEEVEALKAAIAAKQRAAVDCCPQVERERRLGADKRCMELQALLDYVAGRLQCSEQDVKLLADDTGSNGGSGVRGGRAKAKAKGKGALPGAKNGLDVQRLLREQQQAHQGRVCDLVAACNEELRQSQNHSPANVLFSEQGLPRLVEVLGREGLAAVPVIGSGGGRQVSCAVLQRIREAVLKDTGGGALCDWADAAGSDT